MILSGGDAREESNLMGLTENLSAQGKRNDDDDRNADDARNESWSARECHVGVRLPRAPGRVKWRTAPDARWDALPRVP